jgi:tripartite-type tricarboxylate transporter receptor subunit TctC
MRRTFIRVLVAASAWAAIGLPPAFAQTFPAKPVRILVPFPPGGGTDVAARALGEHLQKEFGQPVVVENRPGGNSIIATDAVAKAAPDGHTLLLTTDFHSINAAFGAGLPYDSLKDFAFVARVSTSPLMLVAHPSTNAKTLGELVAAAKASPGKLSFASLGTSSPHYLGFEWFKRMAGADVLDVPYKGGGPALADLLGGQIPVFVAVISTGVPPVKSGRAVALAVTGAKRSNALPEVPTVAETPGLKGYEASNWYGMVAPAGTPKPVIDRLHHDLTAVLNNAGIRDQLAAQGIESATSTPEEFSAYIRSEAAKWGKVIRTANLKAN